MSDAVKILKAVDSQEIQKNYTIGLSMYLRITLKDQYMVLYTLKDGENKRLIKKLEKYDIEARWKEASCKAFTDANAEVWMESPLSVGGDPYRQYLLLKRLPTIPEYMGYMKYLARNCECQDAPIKFEISTTRVMQKLVTNKRKQTGQKEKKNQKRRKRQQKQPKQQRQREQTNQSKYKLNVKPPTNQAILDCIEEQDCIERRSINPNPPNKVTQDAKAKLKTIIEALEYNIEIGLMTYEGAYKELMRQVALWIM